MNQAEEILNYLKKGKKLTRLEALNMFGCMAANSRVSDLRKLGHNIKSEFIKVGEKTVAQYSMEGGSR